MNCVKIVLPLVLVSVVLVEGCSTQRGDGKSTLTIGSLKLCADTVAAVAETEDPYINEPVLSVKLKADAAEHLSRMSASRIGETMPVMLGDRVLMEPVVLDRISGGEFQITNVSAEEMERAQQEMSEAC